MKFEELKNQQVKISDRSITCKDENGKTKGLVLGAERFLKLQPNKQCNYSKQIRSCGLWCSGEMDKVYIYEGKIYYLYNLRSIEFYEEFFAGKPGFENEHKRYQQKKQLADNVAKIGVVIPCYIV